MPTTAGRDDQRRPAGLPAVLTGPAAVRVLPAPVQPPPRLAFAVRLCRAREGPARPLPPARSRPTVFLD